MKLTLKKIKHDTYSFEYDGNIFSGKEPKYSARESLVKYQMDKEGKDYMKNLDEFHARVKEIELEYI